MYNDYNDEYDSLRKKSEWEIREYLERCSPDEVRKIGKSFDKNEPDFCTYPYWRDYY